MVSTRSVRFTTAPVTSTTCCGAASGCAHPYAWRALDDVRRGTCETGVDRSLFYLSYNIKVATVSVMKKFVRCVDVEGEGLTALLGETVQLFCCRYIYRGKLIGVNDTCVLLEDAGIVYATGVLTGPPEDFQRFAHHHYICISSIESFGLAPE